MLYKEDPFVTALQMICQAPQKIDDDDATTISYAVMVTVYGMDLTVTQIRMVRELALTCFLLGKTKGSE